MRVCVALGNSAGKEIPYDYHYLLSSAIYRWIKLGDELLATKLHYSKEIKPFTFSELLGKMVAVDDKYMRINSENVSLIFSSPIKEYVSAFVEGCLQAAELRIGRLSFPVERVEILRKPEIKNRMTFKTLSPVVVSTGIRKRDKVDKWYLYPTDKNWYINIERNLRKKYEFLYGRTAEGTLRIKVLNFKPKKYTVKGPVRASHLTFEASGNTDLIEIGYFAGFGERTAQGFGCVEVVK